MNRCQRMIAAASMVVGFLLMTPGSHAEEAPDPGLAGWRLQDDATAEPAPVPSTDGAVVLSRQTMGKVSLISPAGIPQQHQLQFEFCEAAGGSALHWDMRYVRGTSKYDGLPLVVYQLERDERMGLWTRSEQGWIAHYPGIPGLGLRDVVTDLEPEQWYRAVFQNDDGFTQLRILTLPEEKVVYEKRVVHDSGAAALEAEPASSIRFTLYNYEQKARATELKLRHIRIVATPGKLSEGPLDKVGSIEPPTSVGERQQLTVAVPSLVEFDFEIHGAGHWHGGASAWGALTNGIRSGLDCTPYETPYLTIGQFVGYGFKPHARYHFRAQFTETQDYVQILEADSGVIHSEYTFTHQPLREQNFLIRDEKSEVTISGLRQTPGTVLTLGGEVADPPEGYELVFADDFRDGLARWGAPQQPACGFLRLARYRHWTESGILEIPYLDVTDFILEAEVFQAGGQNGFGVLCRKDPNDDSVFHMFKVGPKAAASFAHQFRFDNGNNNPVAVVDEQTQRGVMLQPRQWHDLKIIAEGNRISGYIDGVKAAELSDSSLRGGGVAIAVEPQTELYVRAVRVYARKGSAFSYKLPTATSSEAVLTPISQPFPLPPQPAETGDKVFVDAKGRAHAYRVSDGYLHYDGQAYLPVKDSDGQYFVRYEPDKWPVAAYEALVEPDGQTLAQIKKYGLTYQIVPAQLSTYIDCTQDVSGFSEDNGLGGASRVLNLDGVKYRVSSSRKSKVNYFLYQTRFPQLGRPYVMVYQVPNDRHRITSVCPLPPESGSAGVVTGGPFPVDHQSYNMMHLFYPRQEKYEFCIFHKEVTEDWAPDAGAAVANIWFLLIDDELASLAPLVDSRTDLPARRLGTIDQVPGFTRTLYGVDAGPGAPPTRQQAAVQSYLDYVMFSGGNMVNYYFLGCDIAFDGPIHYPSTLYKDVLEGVYIGASNTTYNYLDDFLPAADQRGLATYPRIAGFAAKEIYRVKMSLVNGDDSLILNKDGDYCRFFDNRIWDPLHPDVQKLYLDTVAELARLTAPHPGVKGICIDLGPGGWFGSEAIGYSPATLARFSQDTGFAVPTSATDTAYAWLKANCWEQWIDWRCQQIKDLYCRVRDRVREARPDLKLQLKLWINSYYDYYSLPEEDLAGYLREEGLDPRLFEDEPGIEFSCSFVYQDRYLHKGSVDFDKINLPIKTRTALSDIVSYYELPAVLPSVSPRYVGWLATVNLTPVGRNVLDLPTLDLRKNDITHLEFMRWEKALAQMEHLLRRFGAAFRALPAVEPKAFAGDVAVLAGPALDQTLALRWYADRLMVLNDNPEPRRLRLELSGGWGPDAQVMELGRNRVLASSSSKNNGYAVVVELAPFDLQVLKITEE